MCGRYYFTRVSEDEKLDAVNKYMEKNYPGEYKTGEIFPGDIVPAVIDRKGKLVAVPAGFGFPGYQDNKLIINARSETAAEKKTFADCLRDRRVILPASRPNTCLPWTLCRRFTFAGSTSSLTAPIAL